MATDIIRLNSTSESCDLTGQKQDPVPAQEVVNVQEVSSQLII